MKIIFIKAHAKSHTHLQFATANATPKIAKEYVSPTLTLELNKKHRKNKLNEKSTTYNNVYNQLLVCVYSENLTDFPLVRFLLVT